MVGLIPAAGRARRLALAGGRSKELLPVPDLRDPDGLEVPVCEYLLRQYRQAGITELVVVRREEKRDVADHFAGPAGADFDVRDVVVAPTPGSAHSLSLGCRQVPGRLVAVGFPDIVLRPDTLCRDAVETLRASEADLCLAHVPIAPDERRHWDISVLEGARVVRLELKPERSAHRFAWTVAVWTPTFVAFLERWLADPDGGGRVRGEISVGHAYVAARSAGLEIVATVAGDGFALDVGQPERLIRARTLGRGGDTER